MRKKLIGLGICLILMSTACGRQNTEVQQSGLVPASSEEVEAKQSEESERGNEDASAIFAKEECVIQVQTDTQLGSGILWDKQEEFWTFVTAAHVVENEEEADVYLVQEDKILSALVFEVEGLDLAFLKVTTEKISDEIEKAYTECERYRVNVESGEILYAKGYNAYGDKCEYPEVVLENWIYVEDFDNYMLLCKGEAEAGMSGGGVFTEEGKLSGLVCGENEEGMLAILPIAVIESEYQLFINY